MTAEFYALKGMFLAQIGRSDDANKAFSAAVQMHDTLVKAWALWGDYLEGLFTREKYVHSTLPNCVNQCIKIFETPNLKDMRLRLSNVSEFFNRGHYKSQISTRTLSHLPFVMRVEHILQSETLMAHNLLIKSSFPVQLLHINY